jgi:hypothetical protein
VGKLLIGNWDGLFDLAKDDRQGLAVDVGECACSREQPSDPPTEIWNSCHEMPALV